MIAENTGIKKEDGWVDELPDGFGEFFLDYLEEEASKNKVANTKKLKLFSEKYSEVKNYLRDNADRWTLDFKGFDKSNNCGSVVIKCNEIVFGKGSDVRKVFTGFSTIEFVVEADYDGVTVILETRDMLEEL